MRVVLDTNVLLSGLRTPAGVPGRIVAAWIDAEFELVMSLDQVSEVAPVLAYPKIRDRLCWDPERIESFIKQLHVRAEGQSKSFRVTATPAPTSTLKVRIRWTGSAGWMETKPTFVNIATSGTNTFAADTRDDDVVRQPAGLARMAVSGGTPVLAPEHGSRALGASALECVEVADVRHDPERLCGLAVGVLEVEQDPERAHRRFSQ